jgi:hypothetical protein
MSVTILYHHNPARPDEACMGDETMMPDGSMIIAIIFVGILWVFLGACVWRMSHPAPNRDPRRD